ncbi:hypothetical protein JVU11DRAFT_9668 [Chiua virens]|nr:hypothetical protein JVU11DRAFT_12959 [Chiua virens]KAG9310063.1 hypothetical protein JVU11DRAFT_9668 [Chiua virens]
MSDTPPETSAQLNAEQAWMAGALITGAGYGIVAALFWLCLLALWNRLKIKDVHRRRHLLFLIYVCVMFIFGTLFLASNSQFTQLAFVNNRGYPGGPSAYEEQMFSIGVDEISNVSYVLANWLADVLLAWRCVIIYRDFGVRSGRIAFLVTGVMLLASFVLGIFFLLQISSPSSSPYMNFGRSINWTLPYFCLTLGINIAITLLIVVRLLFYRRTMVQLLGPGHATECTTVVAMLIESAAVYATFSLLFLIPYALNSPISYTFLQVLGEAQLIAPLLIIYREAQGKGWISQASSVVSSTVNVDRDVHIERFTDLQFVSQISSSRSGGTRTLELTSKQDPSGPMTVDVEEVRREDIEMHAL